LDLISSNGLETDTPGDTHALLPLVQAVGAHQEEDGLLPLVVDFLTLRGRFV
jgi:hypothetical protein